MESQKIINLLDSNDNESQKFATKRWYIINDQKTLVIMLMVMVRMVLQLNLKLK